MQIGVVHPQVELRGDPIAVRRIGLAVEDLGFDHLLAYDHVLGAVHADRTPPLPGPYTERDPFHDPFVMFAYLAGITERIGFATGILILPQRQTALVARQAADVDLLSGGRLRLGVGVGWNRVEYEALGENLVSVVHARRSRSNCSAGCSPNLSSTSRAVSTGSTALHSCPNPVGPSRSGLVDPAIGRSSAAARLADGFIFFGGGTDNASGMWNRLRDRVTDLGRPADDFGGDYVALSGANLDDLAADVNGCREAGGTHVSLVTMDLGLDSVDAHIDYLASVGDALNIS